jgi:hypothetical protein
MWELKLAEAIPMWLGVKIVGNSQFVGLLAKTLVVLPLEIRLV